MKKKLFAVLIVVCAYALFLLVFTVADKQGKVSQILADIGLSDASAAAQIGSDEAGIVPNPSLRDPMPPPQRKPKLRPNVLQ